MELLPGDEIETGANAAAVLRFRDAGDTLVLERTRVRIGSLEVIFGRMFALLRNRFTVTSETVVAGVEGTRFLFEVGRDRAVRVAVADGAVVCRSPQDAWAPVRLRANEALLSRYPSRAPPTHTAADASELRAYEQLSRDVSSAPEQGWCCRDGQVSPSWSNRCTGSFDTDRADALRQCRPVPPPESSGLVLQRWASHAVDQESVRGPILRQRGASRGLLSATAAATSGHPARPDKKVLTTA